MRASIATALVAVVLVLAWQALAVQYRYDGNWTALYCTGERLQQPPALASEHIWLFRNSFGYDGQFYHYIAHDPAFHRGFDRYVDSPRIRNRRILIPLLAHTLAFGIDRFIDPAYLAVVLLAVFLGAYWLSRYAAGQGWHAWLGVLFLAAPATAVSVDRLTVDVGLAALCVGFVWFLDTGRERPLYAVLLCAPLVRETGFLLLAAYVAALAIERQFARAAIFCTAALPTAAWYWFVARHSIPAPVLLSAAPFAGYLQRILHPVIYPFTGFAAAVTTALDYVGLAGAAMAFLWGLLPLFKKDWSAVAIVAYAFVALAALLNLAQFWTDAYGFGRTLTPLFLLLALRAIRDRRLTAALPVLLVIPRIAMQFAPLAYSVMSGVLGRRV